MKFYVTPLLLLSVLSSCSNNTSVEPEVKEAEQTTESIQVDGRARTYVQYLPKGWNLEIAMPLVFALHGGSVGNPKNMMNNVDLRELADSDKFIAVYPAGVANNWNDGRPTDANLLGVDDVVFFSALIDKMVSNFDIDTGAVFVTGVSNGGFMASRLGCELSDKIAAFAAVSATIEANDIFPNCNPSNNVSALYIHGTLDTFVPFEGGELTKGDGGFAVSHSNAVNKWVTLNEISSNPVITNLPDVANDGTTITESVYSNSSVEVIGYVVENGGHTWPQGTGPNYPNLVGIKSMDMNATEVIWEFFKRNKRG